MVWSFHANFYADVKADDNTHKQNKAYEMIILFHNEGSWTAQDQLLSKSKSGFTGETVLEVELG